MTGFAVVFPGQGSQAAGMGEALARDFIVARDTFAEASDAAGMDLARLCFSDPDRQLEFTACTQPAVLTASLAAWRVLQSETGFNPLLAAGHSLGEYTALAAAGVLTLADAVRAVAERGQAMTRAVPAGQGAMAAVMGSSREDIARACAEAAAGEVVSPANDNAPGQVVISGHAAAVGRAAEILKQKGARVRKLKVSGPFHTSLMGPAAEHMALLFAGMKFFDPAFPVIANIDAAPYNGPASASEKLLGQLTSPVRWRESMEEMHRRGATGFIECGPGAVLAGLLKRTLADVAILPMSDPGHLDAIREALS